MSYTFLKVKIKNYKKKRLFSSHLKEK